MVTAGGKFPKLNAVLDQPDPVTVGNAQLFFYAMISESCIVKVLFHHCVNRTLLVDFVGLWTIIQNNRDLNKV